ncbi:MAG: iron ABC transporter permease [Gammaproteobacteria bacterium]|jgi:iron complex transport system permease protein
MLTNNKLYVYHLSPIFIVLLILSIISIIIGIGFGSVSIFSQTHVVQREIIMQIRMPRVFTAFIVGGLLSLSGALMQVLLRNPLADPYVLGISGGAAVASLLVMLVGIFTSFIYVWAFVGSLFSMLLVMSLVRNSRNFSSLQLLLTGVVIAAGWAAVISFILAISPQSNLRGMLFWLMGDLSYAKFSYWHLLILVAGLLVSLCLAKPLNILARGELTAKSLGINTQRLSWLLYFITSLLTACAVSIAGCIGFVGLIVPHMLRQFGNNDHRFILPGSVLLGGILLTLADTLSRSLMAPIQLPVGVVTAIVGVPCFLFLLQRGVKQ